MIRTFIGAGVLIHGIRGEATIATKALEILEDPEREFVVSTFLILEILPKAIFYANKAEASFYRAYFDEAKLNIPIDEDLLKRALKRAENLGLSAVDAVHLESAISAGATDFITSEKTTKPFFKETAINVINFLKTELRL